ncbi:MAG TPA: glycoside hydrolase family 57 protein [Candidatus Saccharimonadales bacterium]
MKRSICLYLHVHQPYRLRHYTIFDINANHDYFADNSQNLGQSNPEIIKKVAEKSYLPTNQLLLKLLRELPEFSLSLSLSGLVIEQLKAWQPEALESFKELVATGRVEILAESYYHSLGFFFDRAEFERQVEQHRQLIKTEFGLETTAFRNTELAYNNELGVWAEQNGYEAVITEGWDPILTWRSPNFIYRPLGTSRIKLLLKNYKLSDDIAFRFSDTSWKEWPLTADKFNAWIEAIPADQPLINLFMDYETFGEHQWHSTGIFEFLNEFPRQLTAMGTKFMTITQAARNFDAVDDLDIHSTITWADTDRDLSAWLGNGMQQEANKFVYSLSQAVAKSNDAQLRADWRKLTTSDHFYYMCTKWFKDGDVHAYFSPYDTPYEAFMNYMNACHDLKARLLESGDER